MSGEKTMKDTSIENVSATKKNDKPRAVYEVIKDYTKPKLIAGMTLLNKEEIKMKLFTLLKKATGRSENLNGEIFKIEYDNEGRAMFIEPKSKVIFLKTYPIVSKKEDNGIISLTAENGDTYVVIDIHRIIPTSNNMYHPEDPAVEEPVETFETNPESEIKIDFNLVKKVEIENSGINYRDGHFKIKFTFDREISEREFIKFLTTNNYKVHKALNWYEDHSDLTYEGFNTWIYDWVRVYTD